DRRRFMLAGQLDDALARRPGHGRSLPDFSATASPFASNGRRPGLWYAMLSPIKRVQRLC
ncbi:MAG: hypothetical protein AAF543_22235, partial [Pseudomonadota bacterium]